MIALVFTESPDFLDATTAYIKFLELDLRLRRAEWPGIIDIPQEPHILISGYLESPVSPFAPIADLRNNMFDYSPAAVLLDKLFEDTNPIAHELEHVFYDACPFSSSRFMQTLREALNQAKEQSTQIQLRRNLAILLEQGRLKEALPILKQFKECSHDQKQGRMLYAQLLIQYGKLREAMQHIREICKHDPGNIRMHLLMAECYYKADQIERCEKIISELCENYPNHFKSLQKLGDLHFERGHFTEAMQTYERILLQAPQYRAAMEGQLAIVLIRGEDSATSKSILQSSPTIDILKMCNLRATTLACQGQHRAALNLYRNAKAHMRDQSQAFKILMNIGLNLKKKKNPTKALEYFLLCKKEAPSGYTRVDEQIAALESLRKHPA